MKKLMLAAAACLALTCASAGPASAGEAPARVVVVDTVDGRSTYRLVLDGAESGVAVQMAEPEVSRWTMLLLGCAGLGAMIRAARRRLLRSINTYVV